MRLIMDMFSGRPNPSWKLDPATASELLERLGRGEAPVATAGADVLGFRGFIVETELDDRAWRAGVPSRFVVPRPSRAVPAASAVSTSKRPRRSRGERRNAAAVPRSAVPKDSEHIRLVAWLLQTAEGAVDERVLEAARETLREPVRHAAPSESAEERRREPARTSADADTKLLRLATARRCHEFLTPINAEFWDYAPIRFHNNCYNYATNFASNTIAQPGRRAGLQYDAFDCDAVRAAALCDGCLPACDGTARVIALAIWPDTDFHWWRLHPGDLWAHKLGLDTVRSYDNSGRIIGNGITPANCDRGPYTTFCGYFFAPLGIAVA
jgi:hypothetical protein